MKPWSAFSISTKLNRSSNGSNFLNLFFISNRSFKGIKSSAEPQIKLNFPETFASKSIGAKSVSGLGAVTPAP